MFKIFAGIEIAVAVPVVEAPALLVHANVGLVGCGCQPAPSKYSIANTPLNLGAGAQLAMLVSITLILAACPSHTRVLAADGIVPDVIVRLVMVTLPGISGFATPLQFASTKLVTVNTTGPSPGFKVLITILQGPLPVPVAVCPLLKVNVQGPTAVTLPLTVGLILLQIGLGPL